MRCSVLVRVSLAAVLMVAAWALPASGSAQGVSVRSFLSPGSTVGVGSTFLLSVEVTGTQSLDADPVLPDMSAFAQYLGSGSSTNMQMAGGRTTVSLTIQYRFQALEEGIFTIPPVEVRAGGQRLATNALELVVTDAPPAAGAGGGRSEGANLGAEDLFVTAEPSRRTVRDGEPFVVEYRIWTRVDVTSYGVTRLPELQGFWVEEITPEGQPQVEQQVRNGQQYATALIRRVALVPTGPGRRTLEPLGIEAQVRVRNRSRDPFEDLFGRSSLFGTTMVPTAVLSNELTIEVEPLPPGRPEPYSGVVGSLDVSATLDRDTVDANDAVTLTVRVTGSGNLRAVPAPEPDLPPDFEVFPPEVSESIGPAGATLTGSKTFEYVMIPRAPGSRVIPAITLGYYDTRTESYRTVSTPELPLTVTGTVAEGPGSIARGGVTQLREDIRFIRLGGVELRRVRGSPLQGAGLWIFALLPMAAVLGALVLRHHQDRLEGDVAYARGRRAGRVAKKRLALARQLAGGDDARAFYAEVARALRGFAADKLNVPEAGMQNMALRTDLSRRGVEEGVVDRVMECLEHCDRQRFAPSGSAAEERARFVQGAGDLMTALDKELGR